MAAFEEEYDDDAPRPAPSAPAPLPVFGVPPPRPSEKYAGAAAPPGLLFDDERVEFVVETGRYVYTDDDDVAYEWDDAARAWFPTFDEGALERQQSAYAGDAGDAPGEVVPPHVARKKRKAEQTANYTGAADAGDADPPPAQKKAKPAQPKPVTAVYVSGLPPDATVPELAAFFSRCGIIMEDLATGEPRVKIYTSKETGEPKGDALVTYFKPESVDLAVQLLDESELRPGKGPLIRVSKAEFKEKERDPNEPAEKKPNFERKKAIKKLQKLDKQLGWFEEAQPATKAEKFQRVVIIKNVFTKEELEADPTLILDLKDDMRTECEKLGEVTNVILYDQHPDGVMSVRFKDLPPAQACVQLMDGRFFAGRRLAAELYDGRTRYDAYKSGKGAETEEEEKERLERYARWLEGGLEDDEGPKKPAAKPAAPAAAKPAPRDDAVVLEREDENGEPDPVVVDMSGIRTAGEDGFGTAGDADDEGLEMPEGAVLLPGGGWALPPQTREQVEEKLAPPGLAWAGADEEENAALEEADDDEE